MRFKKTFNLYLLSPTQINMKGPLEGEIPNKASLFKQQILGSVLITLGIILAIPLIPGPGALIFILGILLLNFPGKRWLLERRILKRPLRKAKKWLYIKFNIKLIY